MKGLVVLTLAGLAAGAIHGAPSVYPTGTTIYDPARAWSGYTVFVLPQTGAVLIDMNGRTVHEWPAFEGASGGPTRVFPGGYAMGALGSGRPHQESLAIARLDWTGTELWKVGDARQHHDWQRDDFPAFFFMIRAPP